MDLHLVVVGTHEKPEDVPLNGAVQVTTAGPGSRPNLDGFSDGPAIFADAESAPNTQTVVLRGLQLGKANVTFTAEGVGTQQLEICCVAPE